MILILLIIILIKSYLIIEINYIINNKSKILFLIKIIYITNNKANYIIYNIIKSTNKINKINKYYKFIN